MSRKFLTPVQLPADPTNPLEAATKQYVDGKGSGATICTSTTRPASPISGTLIYETDTGKNLVYTGTDWRSVGTNELEPVRVSSIAFFGNITLSGLQTVDGVSLVAGDRVLVRFQTTGAANGIYVVASGAWSRATDANTAAEVAKGKVVRVMEGTRNQGRVFTQVRTVTTIDTDAQSWTPTIANVEMAGSALNFTPAYAEGQLVVAGSSQTLHAWEPVGGNWLGVFGNIVCTSTTRPSIPTKGNIIYETDTKLSYVHDGSAWTLLGSGASSGSPLFDVIALASLWTTTSTTYANVPGMSMTVASVNVSDVFEVNVNLDNELTAGSWLNAQVLVDGAALSPAQGVMVRQGGAVSGSTTTRDDVFRSFKMTGLAAGVHTVTLQACTSAGGTLNLNYGHTTMSVMRVANTLASGGSVPVGAIEMWSTATAPSGYLLCNGSEQPIATYPELAAVLGTTFGALTNGSGVAGSTHFRLPDFSGRSPIGVGRVVPNQTAADKTYTVAQKDGENAHLLTYGESGFRDHYHIIPMASAGAPAGVNDTALRASGGADPGFRTGTAAGGSNYGAAAIGSLNADAAHNTVHPVLGIAYIIKALPDSGLTGQAWVAYTPTAYQGLVTLGNGVLEGRYKLLDAKTLSLQIRLTVGSTTALNTSQLLFGLPAGMLARVANSATQSIPCRYYVSGTNQQLGFASTSSGYGADRVGLIQPGGGVLGGNVLVASSNFDINGILELA